MLNTDGHNEKNHPIGWNVVIDCGGRGTEAVNTVDLLRSCQATYVACLDALGRSLRTQVCPQIQKDLEVKS